jgi:ATP-binding cassette subfamily B protein
MRRGERPGDAAAAGGRSGRADRTRQTDRARRDADRLLLQMTRRGGHWAALLALASTAGAVADTLLPAAAGHTVDVMLRAAGPDAAASQAARWLAVCIALIGVVVLCDAAGEFATGMSTAGATEWLRHKLAGHLLACGLRLPRRYPAGDLVGRMTGGAADASFAAASAVPAAAAVIPPAGSIIALGLIDPWLALAFAAALPALVVALRAFVRDASDINARYQQAQGAITARLLEALAGARTIAAAGTCDQEAARVLIPLAQVRAHGDASWRIQARIAAQGSLIVPLLQVVVLAVAGVELAAHRISPGELLAASQYAVLGAGVGAAISRLGQLSRARAGARRVAEPFAEPAPVLGTEPLPPGPGGLELRAVTVRTDGEPVLNRVSATIAGGSVVAVVGPSGTGKSVLAALAGRLLDPDEGEVRLDGVSLRRLDRTHLRRAVVYAFDRPALFGRTPAEAIAFGISRPAYPRVLSAAGDASAYEFLRRLPAGLDTPLKDAPMSGGETQRVGLARAFAHSDEARLLILDDAMSSLDTVTEMQVAAALTSRLGHRTCLIIAHRAATAARADLVAWLDRGKLHPLRPHRELWPDPRYRAVFLAREPDGQAADA